MKQTMKETYTKEEVRVLIAKTFYCFVIANGIIPFDKWLKEREEEQIIDDLSKN